MRRVMLNEFFVDGPYRFLPGCVIVIDATARHCYRTGMPIDEVAKARVMAIVSEVRELLASLNANGRDVFVGVKV